MASDVEALGQHRDEVERNSVEMPRATAAPMIASLGLTLLAAGFATSAFLIFAGAAVLIFGLSQWIGQLLRGRGHFQQAFAAVDLRAQPIRGLPGTVETLRVGQAGYRLRLPEKVHPLAAGIKGGIVGGLVMPIPALTYGLLSGHGLWYPVNLLAGMLLPGVDQLTVGQLEQFRPVLLGIAVVIHVTMSLVIGLIYGVLLPTLPDFHKPLAWAGLLMPIAWTALSYSFMGAVNPVLRHGVHWPWFIASQFVFGVISGAVIIGAARRGPVLAGILGGIVGGILMSIPAEIWSLASGHGLWYPANLLAGMAHSGMDQLPVEELKQFRGDWLLTAVVIHAAISIGLGVLLSLALPKLPIIPGPVAWGGLLLPLVWTAVSFGLMGVVNPVLQQRVDWPWFIVSQFIFGLVASVVVQRSEQVHIPPAGRGPDSLAKFVEG